MRINHDYAPKIRHKHNIRPEQFHLIVPTIEFGSILSDGRAAIFHHHHGHYDVHVELVVKIITKRDEAWVSTFHQVDLSEVRRKRKLYRLIRE